MTPPTGKPKASSAWLSRVVNPILPQPVTSTMPRPEKRTANACSSPLGVISQIGKGCAARRSARLPPLAARVGKSTLVQVCIESSCSTSFRVVALNTIRVDKLQAPVLAAGTCPCVNQTLLEMRRRACGVGCPTGNYLTCADAPRMLVWLRALQGVGLLRGGQKFDQVNQLHREEYSTNGLTGLSLDNFG
jgi:hypothetical protein